MTCPICNKSNILPGSLVANQKLRSQVDQLRRSNISPTNPQTSNTGRSGASPMGNPSPTPNTHVSHPQGNYHPLNSQSQSAPNIGNSNPPYVHTNYHNQRGEQDLKTNTHPMRSML
jgi:hypothetical protein